MITLLSVIDRHRHDLLDQFVSHYRALGVDRFLLACHVDPAWRWRERWMVMVSMSAALMRLSISDWSTLWRSHDAMAALDHRLAWRDAACSTDDWIVWADLDEFQDYSAIAPGGSLPDVVRLCEAHGYDAVMGEFLDHIPPDGSLTPFDPSRPIWDQYPRTCRLTRDVLCGADSKLVFARAHIRPVPGCHAICGPGGEWIGVPGRGLGMQGASIAPGLAVVHHFKWDAAVLNRLRDRLTDDWKARCSWWVETQRFFQHVQAHGSLAPPPDAPAPPPAVGPKREAPAQGRVLLLSNREEAAEAMSPSQ